MVYVKITGEEHGTNRGYHRHLRARPRQEPCAPCADAHREYGRRAGRGKPRELQPCGTRGAYFRHLSAGEVTDAACCAAYAAYQRPYNRKYRERKGKARE